MLQREARVNQFYCSTTTLLASSGGRTFSEGISLVAVHNVLYPYCDPQNLPRDDVYNIQQPVMKRSEGNGRQVTV